MRSSAPSLRPYQPRPRIVRALTPALLVVACGTCGFMWIEHWGFWKSLFFTLITITTVGYGDYGLSASGERFTAVLLVCGIGVATYGFGQAMQAFIEYQLAWSRRMKGQIDKLHNHYLVCGLGRIGQAVCERLAEQRVPFVGVDVDEELVKKMHDRGFIAMIGDATDETVLEQSGILRAQGIACVTDSDTENIVMTFTARGMNPDLFVVSRADTENSIAKIKRAGASRVISPVRSGSDTIANTILNPHLAEFLDHSGELGREIGFAEVKVSAGSTLEGSTVAEYGGKHRDVVFIAVQHPGGLTSVRPSKDDALKAGDIVIVAGATESVKQFHEDAATLRKAA